MVNKLVFGVQNLYFSTCLGVHGNFIYILGHLLIYDTKSQESVGMAFLNDHFERFQLESKPDIPMEICGAENKLQTRLDFMFNVQSHRILVWLFIYLHFGVFLMVNIGMICNVWYIILYMDHLGIKGTLCPIWIYGRSLACFFHFFDLQKLQRHAPSKGKSSTSS